MSILSKFRKKSRVPKYQIKYSNYRNFSPKRKSTKLNLKKRPNFISRIGKLFTFSFIVAVLILIIYLLFFSGYTNVKQISFKNESFETQAISKEIVSSLKDNIGKNLFFLDIEKLQNKVLQNFPEIEKVTLSKNYPNQIEIEFAEYPLVTNVINETSSLKKSYVINSIGYAIKENFENPNLPYIRIKSEEPINIQNTVIDSKKLSYILNAKKYFEDKFGMKVKEIIYKPIAREIHLLTERDFFIWLDIQVPAENQLKKLKKSLVKLDIYKENLAYIDLRIAGGAGDKIIYKRK